MARGGPGEGAVSAVTYFESAWDQKPEGDLPVSDFRRRQHVLRRQSLVHLCREARWTFLTGSPSVPSRDSLVAGIRLDARRDFLFLDLLRASPALWASRAVEVINLERPFYLPGASPSGSSPMLAIFEGGSLERFAEGDDAFKLVWSGDGVS